MEMMVRVARGLGDLRPEVVFVGGAVVELLVTVARWMAEARAEI